MITLKRSAFDISMSFLTRGPEMRCFWGFIQANKVRDTACLNSNESMNAQNYNLSSTPGCPKTTAQIFN